MLAAFLIFMICDFITGTAFQALDAQERWRIRVPSPAYHHDLKPNFEIQEKWGSARYPLLTNSLGFRDSKIRTIPLQTQNHRVLFLGDSFTEGLGLPYSQTYAGRIEKEWAKQKVEILNAAVMGYCVIIYYRKIKYLLEFKKLHFDELVLFLDVSDMPDDTDRYYLDANGNVQDHDPAPQPLSRPRKILHFFKQHFLTARFISALRDSWRWSRVLNVKPMFSNRRSFWAVAPGDAARIKRQHYLETSEGYLNQLHELLSSRNIPMTLVIYPWPDQIQFSNQNITYISFWENWCRTHHVAFMDFISNFSDAGSSWEQVVNRYYILGDVHFNAEGHQKMAQRFLDYWAKNHAVNLGGEK